MVPGRQLLIGSIIVALVVAFAVVVAAIAYFPARSRTGSMTSSTEPSPTPSTGSAISTSSFLAQVQSTAPGLSLRLSLSSSSIGLGGDVVASVSEFNTLGQTNNLSVIGRAGPPWGLQAGQNYCGGRGLPFGVAVFRGRFGLANLSTASPLPLINPTVTYDCTYQVNPQYYVFGPRNESASILSRSNNGLVNMGSMKMAYDVNLHGYWDSSGVEHGFTPGTYTVVAADYWGQMDFSYFTVSQ